MKKINTIILLASLVFINAQIKKENKEDLLCKKWILKEQDAHDIFQKYNNDSLFMIFNKDYKCYGNIFLPKNTSGIWKIKDNNLIIEYSDAQNKIEKNLFINNLSDSILYLTQDTYLGDKANYIFKSNIK